MRVLLGVSGGIAAYKSAELVRALKGEGHEVRCALTRAAEAFVAPLTLEVLSTEPVYRQEYLAPSDTGEEVHIEAARWADVLCVVPATAHTLARLAQGLADDFLSTTALAFDGPVVVAPAMHEIMWLQPAVQENVARLRSRGVEVVGPVIGALASGESGVGRLAALTVLLDAVGRAERSSSLEGRTVLVTAGPTREAIDPVRFLSNRSTGKMGFALAAEAARRGARTLLVAGPVELDTPRGVEREDVVTAAEMAEAVKRHAAEADLVIMAAAVGDFRAPSPPEHKLKKAEFSGDLDLERTTDILLALEEWAPDAVRVGFAAETRDLEREATRKLHDKGAHMIIGNDISRSDIGFGGSDNEVLVVRPDLEPVLIPKASKLEIARELFELLEPVLVEQHNSASQIAG